MKFTTYADAIAKKADGDDVVGYVVDRITEFTDGVDVDLDFLDKKSVGAFCTAIGIERNWAELELDEIAPEAEEEGVNVVPADEATAILSTLEFLMKTNRLDPEAEGEKSPNLLNDFLPEGRQFKGETCLGHLWEFQYALAVELEHGVTRGTNVTQNHPLLTGLVVMAHLAEDRLYYARLWVMEAEGELFNAELEGKTDEVLDTLADLTLAKKHLAARLSEKIDIAQKQLKKA